MKSIGFLEINSIAKGIAVADLVLKTAAVDMVFSRAGCPGKYYLLFTGAVSAVQASIDAATQLADTHLVDACLIANVHPQVIQAVHMTGQPTAIEAIGVMEFLSVTASIYAADIAVKTGDVEVIEIRLGTGIGGKSFVVVTGDVSATNEAIAAGVASEHVAGLVVSSVVIPRPHQGLLEMLL